MVEGWLSVFAAGRPVFRAMSSDGPVIFGKDKKIVSRTRSKGRRVFETQLSLEGDKVRVQKRELILSGEKEIEVNNDSILITPSVHDRVDILVVEKPVTQAA